MDLTEQEIAAVAYKKLFHEKASLFLNIYAWQRFECDLMQVSDEGYMHEFEIKTTKFDFDADFSKENANGEKHELIASGASGLKSFNFIVPEGMVGLDEVPDEYGLYYVTLEVDSLQMVVIRRPKWLPRPQKVGPELLLDLYKKSHRRYSSMLFGRFDRAKNRVQREFWNGSK